MNASDYLWIAQDFATDIARLIGIALESISKAYFPKELQ